MPFKSEAQRRYLWMKHPGIARQWSDEAKGKRRVQKNFLSDGPQVWVAYPPETEDFPSVDPYGALRPISKALFAPPPRGLPKMGSSTKAGHARLKAIKGMTKEEWSKTKHKAWKSDVAKFSLKPFKKPGLDVPLNPSKRRDRKVAQQIRSEQLTPKNRVGGEFLGLPKHKVPEAEAQALQRQRNLQAERRRSREFTASRRAQVMKERGITSRLEARKYV